MIQRYDASGGLGNSPSLISSTYGEGWGLVTINTELHLYYSEGGEKGEPIKGDSKFTFRFLLISDYSILFSIGPF